MAMKTLSLCQNYCISTPVFAILAKPFDGTLLLYPCLLVTGSAHLFNVPFHCSKPTFLQTIVFALFLSGTNASNSLILHNWQQMLKYCMVSE
jgi:hypothetical protein